DINHDQRADVCARGFGGLLCAVSSGAGFGPSIASSLNFDNNTGWALDETYYSTVHFADVDGDGWVDVCGRASEGIECALNTHGNTFAPRTIWLQGDFDNNSGWIDPPRGTTVQYADVNGDGRADVCGRSPDGIRCALATNIHTFSPSSLWS